MDLVESIRRVVRGKMGQGNKVDSNSLEEASKLKGILSNGHSSMSAKDDIWVIVMTHRNVITMENLAISQGIVKTIITAVSLVI